MKIVAFEVRNDELNEFEVMKNKYGLTIKTIPDVLTAENIKEVDGYDAISILGRSIMKKEMLDLLKNKNIKYIATRTIGCDHIDLEYAERIGIKVCNSRYEPNGVADFTVMLMLLTIRKYKPVLWRQNVNDYSLSGLMGKEMRNLTVGIMGTGRIGAMVIKELSGFGCEILAYDIYHDKEVEKFAKYVDLDTLYKKCDMISIHMPLLVSTRNIINDDAISKMKDGVILINSARAELMDMQAIIKNVESEKIGAVGLDVFENEEFIYHINRKTDIIKNRDMAYLRQFPNVVMTPHMAFYTDLGIKGMVDCAIEGILKFKELERKGKL